MPTLTSFRRLLRQLATGRGADSGTANRASAERYKKIALGAAAAAVSRGASIVSVFVSVPLVLHEYGSNLFALWATLTSLTLLLAFSDFGLASGLVNLLGDARAAHRRLLARQYVANTVALLTFVMGGLAALFVLASLAVNWGDAFGLSAVNARRAAQPATLAFAACFLVGLPLAVSLRVHIAYEESALGYSWWSLGSILSVVALAVVVAAHGPFTLAIVATVGGPAVAALLNAVVLFGWQRPWLRPRIQDLDLRSMGLLLRTGALFCVVQSSAAIAYQSDALVIAQVRGSGAVTNYVIPLRLFAFLPTIVALLLVPFWPAFRSALLSRDIQWVTRGLRRSIWLCLALVTPPTLAFLIWASPILHIWTGRAMHPGLGLLLGLAAWVLLSAIVTPLWTLLVAANALRPLAVMASVMAVANLGLSIVLTREIGVQGAILGTVITQVAFLLVPAAIYTRALVDRLAAADPATEASLEGSSSVVPQGTPA